MTISLPPVFAAMAMLLAAANATADDKVVHLVSLDWQPYAGTSLTAQGASTAVIKAAFQAVGYRAEVDFYPWARAIYLTRNDKHYAGVFPVYYSAERARSFNCSRPIGDSPLGFAERSDARVRWSSLADLMHYKIGVVRDYVNTEAFDNSVTNKQLTVDVASNDIQNLQKLAHGHIDLAVIDRNVFDYLLKNTRELKNITNLRFNEHLLEDKKLYICFKRDSNGNPIAADFAAGLQRIDSAAIMSQYMRGMGLE